MLLILAGASDHPSSLYMSASQHTALEAVCSAGWLTSKLDVQQAGCSASQLLWKLVALQDVAATDLEILQLHFEHDCFQLQHAEYTGFTHHPVVLNSTACRAKRSEVYHPGRLACMRAAGVPAHCHQCTSDWHVSAVCPFRGTA